jgi:hypothetical protein
MLAPMTQSFESRRNSGGKLEDSETAEQAERGNSGVDVQTGRETDGDNGGYKRGRREAHACKDSRRKRSGGQLRGLPPGPYEGIAGRRPARIRPMAVSGKCLVGILLPGGALVRAFDVRLSGTDVYVNYGNDAHASYHASGQLHFKKYRNYIEWDGGPSGAMQPMKFFKIPPGDVYTRSEVGAVGWKVSELLTVRPTLRSTPDMTVDALQLPVDSILTFQVSVVGANARGRTDILGYPIIAAHRIGALARVEIEAFVVS